MPGKCNHSCPLAAFFLSLLLALLFMAASSSYPTRSSDRARNAATQISTTFRTSPWKALRTTNALERINEEFRRRTKTQASLPSEEAVLLLLFGLLRSGQVTLRRLVGWHDLATVSEQPEAA